MSSAGWKDRRPVALHARHARPRRRGCGPGAACARREGGQRRGDVLVGQVLLDARRGPTSRGTCGSARRPPSARWRTPAGRPLRGRRAASCRGGRGARSSRLRWSSQSANANMPRRRGTTSSPHSSYPCSTTSASECVRSRWPARLQLPPQLEVVVDLAVEDEVAGVVFVVQGLLAARHVDDREAAEGEPGLAVEGEGGVVRAAVGERAPHGGKDFARGRLTRPSHDARDATHPRWPPVRPGAGRRRGGRSASRRSRRSGCGRSSAA